MKSLRSPTIQRWQDKLRDNTEISEFLDTTKVNREE